MTARVMQRGGVGQREHCQHLSQLWHSQSCRSAPGDPARLFSCLFFLGVSLCHALRLWISAFLCLSPLHSPFLCIASLCLGLGQVLPLSLPFLFSSLFGSFVLPSPLLSLLSFSALSSAFSLSSPSTLPDQLLTVPLPPTLGFSPTPPLPCPPQQWQSLGQCWGGRSLLQ